MIMEIKCYEDKYLNSLNVLLEEAFHVSKQGNTSSCDIELIAVIERRGCGTLVTSTL